MPPMIWTCLFPFIANNIERPYNGRQSKKPARILAKWRRNRRMCPRTDRAYLAELVASRTGSLGPRKLRSE